MDLFYGFLIILLAAEFCVIVRLKSEKKKIGYRKAVGFGLVILLTLAVLIFDLKLSYLLIVLAAVSLFWIPMWVIILITI